MAGHGRPASQAVPGQRPAPGAQREGADPDLPGTRSSPPPPEQPLASPPLVLSFSQTGGSGCRPRGQRQGGAPLCRAHARASARGWSKQTLLKGHFFRLRLRRPEEAAIIFQGCKCQKKNSPSPSFPPCPSSVQRLLTRHFLAK